MTILPCQILGTHSSQWFQSCALSLMRSHWAFYVNHQLSALCDHRHHKVSQHVTESEGLWRDKQHRLWTRSRLFLQSHGLYAGQKTSWSSICRRIYEKSWGGECRLTNLMLVQFQQLSLTLQSLIDLQFLGGMLTSRWGSFDWTEQLILSSASNQK